MFKKALLAIGLIGWLAYGLVPVTQVSAQNIQCPDRPDGDESNACANTRFVSVNGGGGGNCTVFSEFFKGCVPASGGGTLNYLRADGTWAQPPGTIPVGGILPWAGSSVPPGYLLAYGQAIDRTTFSQLYTALTFDETVNCTISSPTVSVIIGTSDRVPIGAKIEGVACFAAGTTVISKGSGTITMSTNATATTSTSLRIFIWGNGDGSTTFNVPNLMGRVPFGRNNMSGTDSTTLNSSVYGVNPNAIGGYGGYRDYTLLTANLPPITPAGTITAGGSVTINDPGHFHTTATVVTFIPPIPFPGVTSGGVAASLSYTNMNTDSKFTGISATFNGSGGTFTGSVGGGSSTPHTLINPGVTVDYVIKAFDTDATVANLVVGTTIITGGSPNTILYDNGGILGELSIATIPERLAGTAMKIIDGTSIYPPETVVTYGTTTTFDFSTFLQASVTLTGNITTMTATNVTGGRAGSIAFIQDGTGSRTTVWATQFKFAGGTAPVLSTAADAVDILSYSCRTTTFCSANLIKDVR